MYWNEGAVEPSDDGYPDKTIDKDQCARIAEGSIDGHEVGPQSLPGDFKKYKYYNLRVQSWDTLPYGCIVRRGTQGGKKNMYWNVNQTGLSCNAHRDYSCVKRSSTKPCNVHPEYECVLGKKFEDIEKWRKFCFLSSGTFDELLTVKDEFSHVPLAEKACVSGCKGNCHWNGKYYTCSTPRSTYRYYTCSDDGWCTRHSSNQLYVYPQMMPNNHYGYGTCWNYYKQETYCRHYDSYKYKKGLEKEECKQRCTNNVKCDAIAYVDKTNECLTYNKCVWSKQDMPPSLRKEWGNPYYYKKVSRTKKDDSLHGTTVEVINNYTFKDVADHALLESAEALHTFHEGTGPQGVR